MAQNLDIKWNPGDIKWTPDLSNLKFEPKVIGLQDQNYTSDLRQAGFNTKPSGEQETIFSQSVAKDLDNKERLKLDTSTTQQDQALKSAALASQAQANANKLANVNAGINKSKAGMLGAQTASTNTADTANALYVNNASNAASTQADYLSKMNAASQLDAEASGADATARNMNKSAGLAALQGGLSGAASGAMMGMVISDENCKQADDGVDTDELLRSMEEFKELYIRLKKLKGENK